MKTPETRTGRFYSQTKSQKFNFHKTKNLLSKNLVVLFVILLTLTCVLGNFQAKGKINFQNDSSIFISLISPEEDLEIVKNTNKDVQQTKLYALASFGSALEYRKEPSIEDQDLNLAFSDQTALVKNTGPENETPDQRSKIIEYEVKEGETVSQIAAKFGISSNTIFWANEDKLPYQDSLITAGDILKILPTTGVAHQVSEGETLESIVQKYQADLNQTLAYNKLINTTDIEKGEVLIIPQGKKQEVKPKPRPRVYFASTPSSRYTRPRYKGRGGWCTDYVAAKTGVRFRGNAGTWLSHAKTLGYEIGNTPKPGAIIVTRESWWGHVGVVESVGNGTITISEQNYKGYGIVNTRTLPISSRVIKGYIYR